MPFSRTNEGTRPYGLGVWGIESDGYLLLTGIFHLSEQFSC